MLVRPSAIRNFLREVLDGGIDVSSKAGGALPGEDGDEEFHAGNTPVSNDPVAVYDVPLDRKPVIPQNAETGEGGLVVEPPVGDEEYTPVNTTELGRSLAVLAKGVDQDKIEKVYNDFKEFLLSLKDEGDRMKDRMINIEGISSRKELRKHIRKLVEADVVDDGSLLHDDPVVSDLDSDVIPGESQDLATIAKAIGAKSAGGVGGTEQRALKKLRFLLSDLSPAELEEMMSTATSDYIHYLARSKVLGDEEIDYMRANREVVRDLDGFRDFLGKYIKRAAKSKGVDVGWAPKNKPRGKYAKPAGQNIPSPVDAELDALDRAAAQGPLDTELDY